MINPSIELEAKKDDCGCHENKKKQKCINIEQWHPCVDLDPCLSDVLKSQNDREFCSFTFLNNLTREERGSNAAKGVNIVYLKISHVFYGREAFVYETTDLAPEVRFMIDDYAIGVDYENSGSGPGTVKVGSQITDQDKKNDKFVRDIIYVQFVVLGEDGKYQLYSQEYSNTFGKMTDLFGLDGELNKEKYTAAQRMAYMKLVNIHMYFHPLHNLIGKKLELVISVSTPSTTILKVQTIETTQECKVKIKEKEENV